MQAIVNSLYPNRIQLILSVAPAVHLGPLATAGGASFDATSDLEVYVDGNLTAVPNWLYDAAYDQYLLYTATTLPVGGVIQVVYHIPATPFLQADGSTVLPGFALIAQEATGADPVSPVIGVAVPASSNQSVIFSSTTQSGWNIGGFSTGGWGSGGIVSAVFPVGMVSGWDVGGYGQGGYGTAGTLSVAVEWFASGVPNVRLQSSNLPLDSGLIVATSLSGFVALPPLPANSTLNFTLAAFDEQGDPILVAGAPLILPFTIVTSPPPPPSSPPQK